MEDTKVLWWEIQYNPGHPCFDLYLMASKTATEMPTRWEIDTFATQKDMDEAIEILTKYFGFFCNGPYALHHVQDDHELVRRIEKFCALDPATLQAMVPMLLRDHSMRPGGTW